MQTNLMKIWYWDGGGGGTSRSPLINTMAHRHKNPKKIILCHTNAVILQTIVIIIDIVSTYLKKINRWD